MHTWTSTILMRQFKLLALALGLGGDLVVLCPTPLVGYVGCYLSLMGAAYGLWLVEQGGYELACADAHSVVLWYLFSWGAGVTSRLFCFSWGATVTTSIERFFRNARWLEREVGEMFNVWFGGKRDRRALFLVPLLYWGVLRRYFPVGGFFELRLQPGEGRLAAFHITWVD